MVSTLGGCGSLVKLDELLGFMQVYVYLCVCLMQ